MGRCSVCDQEPASAAARSPRVNRNMFNPSSCRSCSCYGDFSFLLSMQPRIVRVLALARKKVVIAPTASADGGRVALARLSHLHRHQEYIFQTQASDEHGCAFVTIQGDKTLLDFSLPSYCLPQSCLSLPETNLTTKASQFPKPHSYSSTQFTTSDSTECSINKTYLLANRISHLPLVKFTKSEHPQRLANACMSASSTSTSNPQSSVHCLLATFLPHVFAHVHQAWYYKGLYESARCLEKCRTVYAVNP